MFSLSEIMSAASGSPGGGGSGSPGGGMPGPMTQPQQTDGMQQSPSLDPIRTGPNYDEQITRIQGEMQSIAGRLQQDQMLVQMGDRGAAGRIGQMQVQIQALQQRLSEAQQGKAQQQMQAQQQGQQEQQMQQDYLNRRPMAGSVGGMGGGGQGHGSTNPGIARLFPDYAKGKSIGAGY